MPDPATLKIYIDSEETTGVGDLAEMLAALETAFEDLGGGAAGQELRLRRIETGSLLMLFDVVAAGYEATKKIYENRDALRAILDQMAIGVRLSVDADLPASARAFLGLCALPVAEGKAASVEMYERSDNEPGVIINGDNATVIVARGNVTYVDRRGLERSPMRHRSNGRNRASATIGTMEGEGNVQATLATVDGRWSAQVPGMKGSLAASYSEDIGQALQSWYEYVVIGKVSNWNGAPSGFRVLEVVGKFERASHSDELEETLHTIHPEPKARTSALGSRKVVSEEFLLSALRSHASKAAASTGYDVRIPRLTLVRYRKQNEEGVHWDLSHEAKQDRFLQQAREELMPRYDVTPLRTQ